MIFPHWEEGEVWAYEICTHVLFILLTPSFHPSLSLDINWVTWSECHKEPSCVFFPRWNFFLWFGVFDISHLLRLIPAEKCAFPDIWQRKKSCRLILLPAPPTQHMPKMSLFMFYLPPSGCWILTNDEAFLGLKYHQELSHFLFLSFSGVDFSLMSHLTAKLYQESKWGKKKGNQQDKREDIEANCQLRAICINFPPPSCSAFTSCVCIQRSSYTWAHVSC